LAAGAGLDGAGLLVLLDALAVAPEERSPARSNAVKPILMVLVRFEMLIGFSFSWCSRVRRSVADAPSRSWPIRY
jgi:hypothetical protein